MSNSKEVNILVCVTGSVAAIKLPNLIQSLLSLTTDDRFIKVRVVATENSLHFFPYETIEKRVPVYRDRDEWSAWKEIGDDVLHIELRKWADIGLIAPLDANTCAKIANGMCDNLLTCIIRAWDISKPLYFAPAMNVHMWKHPVTSDNITKLMSFGYIEIAPISKRLACGDVGCGAMAEVDTIVDVIKQTF